MEGCAMLGALMQLAVALDHIDPATANEVRSRIVAADPDSAAVRALDVARGWDV